MSNASAELNIETVKLTLRIFIIVTVQRNTCHRFISMKRVKVIINLTLYLRYLIEGFSPTISTRRLKMAQIEVRVEEEARQNGGKGSEELQTLLGEMSQLKESLRLEKSRNADVDSKNVDSRVM